MTITCQRNCNYEIILSAQPLLNLHEVFIQFVWIMSHANKLEVHYINIIVLGNIEKC